MGDVVTQVAEEARSVEAERADREAAATSSYADLIRRAAKNRSRPEDRALLETAIDAMGITPEDARRDVAALREITRLEALLSDGSKLDAANQAMSEARQTLEAAAAEWQKQLEQLKARFAAASNNARVAAEEESNARKELGDLKKRHPRIFPPAPARPTPPVPPVSSSGQINTGDIGRWNDKPATFEGRAGEYAIKSPSFGSNR